MITCDFSPIDAFDLYQDDHYGNDIRSHLELEKVTLRRLVWNGEVIFHNRITGNFCFSIFDRKETGTDTVCGSCVTAESVIGKQAEKIIWV